MANIRDIAKKAGVGIATVSRYLNNTGYVSEEVSIKIQQAVDELNYKPNALARAIFTKSSKTIALIVPNISNPFFDQMALVVEEYTSKEGYNLFLCNTNDKLEREINHLETLQRHRVDGILVARGQCKKEYDDVQVPVVSFETHVANNIITVSSDNFIGGKEAFNHLYEKGCKKILHIKGPKKFEALEERCRGFLDAASKKNYKVDVIEFNSDIIEKMCTTDFDKLCHIEKYDGIFAFNDIAGAHIMRFLKNKGIEIPQQIQIIGYDNSFICDLLYPALTTIEQPIREIAGTMIELLLKLINKEEVIVKDYLIPTKLIQRESTLK